MIEYIMQHAEHAEESTYTEIIRVAHKKERSDSIATASSTDTVLAIQQIKQLQTQLKAQTKNIEALLKGTKPKQPAKPEKPAADATVSAVSNKPKKGSGKKDKSKAFVKVDKSDVHDVINDGGKTCNYCHKLHHREDQCHTKRRELAEKASKGNVSSTETTVVPTTAAISQHIDNRRQYICLTKLQSLTTLSLISIQCIPSILMTTCDLTRPRCNAKTSTLYVLTTRLVLQQWTHKIHPNSFTTAHLSTNNACLPQPTSWPS